MVMDSQEIKLRRNQSDLQSLNIVGFILFSANLFFKIGWLFLSLMIYFIVIVILSLKLLKKVGEYRKVKIQIWRTLINCSIFSLLCSIMYLRLF